MALDRLQQVQKEFDMDYWQHNDSEVEKVRHITLHLMKTLGKLSTYVEQRDHGARAPLEQVKNEVIPDLLFHALQLVNLYDVQLGEQYKKRIEELTKRFGQN